MMRVRRWCGLKEIEENFGESQGLTRVVVSGRMKVTEERVAEDEQQWNGIVYHVKVYYLVLV